MSNINKTDVIRLVSTRSGIPQRLAAPVVDELFNSITELTDKGLVVSIKGFGKFQKKHRAARTGRNPSTGEAVPIAECDKLMFTASK